MPATNPGARLEAFSDGVFAIAITLLVIDIKIPSSIEIGSNNDFWLALKYIAPSIFAFTLSFAVILITWANHHANFRLLNKSSNLFIYANGFLLLTVVFMPFPTSLLGEYLLTEYAAPAVILYNAVMALQAVGWILITDAELRGHLSKDERSALQIRDSRKFAYFAFVLYALLAIIAIWFPLSSAIVTTLTWIFWLIFGISIRHE